jgi:hypothetical protein
MSTAQYTGIGSYKCYCLLLILAYSSVVFIFTTFAAYTCLGIYFLNQDYYIRAICPPSILWEYILLSVIFAGNKLSVYFLKNFTKKDYKFIKGVNLGSLIIESILLLVGGFGLFYHSLSCDSDTNLCKFGISSFLLQIIYFFVAGYMAIDNCVYGPPRAKAVLPKIDITMDAFEMDEDVFIEENTDDVIGPEFARLDVVSEI